jgi:hypothetical protein
VLARQYLPPISVGASVDKMFAVGYRPYKTGFSGVWLKNDQSSVFEQERSLEPRFIVGLSGFPQIA